MKRSTGIRNALALASVLTAFPLTTLAQKSPTPVPPVSNPCTPRFAAGSVIAQPPALFSQNGVLNVRFSYQQTIDSLGNPIYCFMTPDGIQEPTLHVNPGDTLNITVTNNTQAQPFGETFNTPNCGDTTVQFPTTSPPLQQGQQNPNGIASVGSSVNIHYHGTNVTPQCGGDNVTKTLINSGSTFQYSFTFPTNEPPGLYWYHPHVHGLAERDLLGGATGALVVDGIQNVQPAVQGLPQRLLIVRDQTSIFGAGAETMNCGNGIPFQDLSVNYVPIVSFQESNGTIGFTPAVLQMQQGATEFWRVVNSAADTILDLQVMYDGVSQTMQIVSIDAVPVNSQEGPQPPKLIPVTRFRLPVASRVEFLVKAPASTVKVAQLVTNNINTGPQGDCDPTRALFNISLTHGGELLATREDRMPTFTALSNHQQRFGGALLDDASTVRTLQFSEIQPTQFFITVAGQTPVVFDNNHPPAIVTHQGAVERWIVQNLAQENHEFHMHQIHFQVLAQENFETNGATQAPAIDGQFLDMVEVPFWDNVKNPNGPVPDVQLKMDFRGMDIGDFVYHCHILSHEDLGMMAIIRVTKDE
ncbi:MAG: multicopper oxidase domain-containing protein [Silvibacterium sp.]|nr:multicopper oxidase domain-containing protein [Silvibacterium sp.]